MSAHDQIFQFLADLFYPLAGGLNGSTLNWVGSGPPGQFLGS